jgi:endonuclease/exonuclease/phosphatase family metal-dependent hydrolase
MPLRVMTWNTLYASASTPFGSWEERAPLIVETVLAEQPDVLALQEIDRNQIDFTYDAFPGYRTILGSGTGISPLPRRVVLLMPVALVLWALLWVRAGAPPWSPLETVLHAALFLVAIVAPVGLFALERYRGPFREPGELLPILYRPDRLRPRGDGTVWFSRTPSQPASRLPLAMEPRAFHWARFETLEGGLQFLVVNAHLGHAPWHYAGSASVLLETIERERPSAEAPVILVGDFNALPQADVLQRLYVSMRDAWSTASAREGPETTFQWNLMRGMRPLRLDHVLVSGPVTPVLARVLTPRRGPMPPSDHDPIVVDLELTPGP